MSLNLDKSTWKRVAFGDVVSNVNITVRDPESVGIDRVVAMEHMDPGELKVQRWGSIEDGTTFTRRVTPGQTLFGKRRAYQRKVALAEFDAICSGDILTFEAVETRMLPKFLPFLVQSNEFFDHALGTSAGSLSPRTNWRDLSKYEFDLPPLDEQKRIADLLWALERHHEVVKVSFASARQVLSRTRAALFDAKSKTIPASEAFSITIGRQRAPKYQTGDDLIPYLRSANVTHSGINIEDVKSMNFTAKEQLKFGLKTGDVLVSEASASASAVGMPAVWNNEIQTVVGFQNTLLRFRALDGITLPGFVEQWCRWAFESGEFLAAASGTNIRHIGVGGASGMQVRVPGLEDQSLFLEQINTIAASVDSARLEVKTLRSLGAAILTEVFGGN